MPSSNDDAYTERCLFQRALDDTFSRGAVCAVLEIINGRLQHTRLLGSTGRLFCSDARRRSSVGPWEYEVLIDSRRSEKPDGEPVRVWIREIVRNPAVEGLWEARVVGESGQVLRLNASQPARARPSKRMRLAVTKVYESELFPTGLTDSTQSPLSSDRDTE